MHAFRKHASARVFRDKELPAATFKCSLRAWQARYKAQRGIASPVSGKALSQGKST
jgi:hypothetical protein